MRFLRKNKIKKTILVISDIHLGAGPYINGNRNFLEDFHFDTELVDFLEHYSSGDYSGREVELIINGDLFDLLAVPFVKFYDDEYWSEEAASQKLDLILKAHFEVVDALKTFLSHKNNKIVYIIGNHDAEIVLPQLQEKLIKLFGSNGLDNFELITKSGYRYIPVEGVHIYHGHEYEFAHSYCSEKSILKDDEGKTFFLPPWGSYYVIRVLNKFKEFRGHVNAVRPIKKFIINGLIYDTLFIIRFCLANFFYFVMVRCAKLFRPNMGIMNVVKDLLKELELFKDYEEITQEEFLGNKDIKVLIVGHTHEPAIRNFSNGKTFINTGTWTKMYNLDFDKNVEGTLLTYAQIDIKSEEESDLEVSLLSWKGTNIYPFVELS